jgi:hypothetical protein
MKSNVILDARKLAALLSEGQRVTLKLLLIAISCRLI